MKNGRKLQPTKELDTASIRFREMLPRLDALVAVMNELEPERHTDRTAIVKAAMRKFLPEMEAKYGIKSP